MSIWHPIAESRLFQNLTLKFKGQGHGWGHSSKSQCGVTSYRLTSLSFHVDRPSHSSDTAFSKFDLENQGSTSWVRSHFKSQWGSNILSTHIPFVPCQSGIPFVSYDFFKIWPWKSKVKVMGEVTVQSHNVGLASYQLTSFSFHVNQPSHSWDTSFSKFDLGYQGSR